MVKNSVKKVLNRVTGFFWEMGQ